MLAVQRIVNELNQRKEHYQHLVLLYYTELLILLRRYLDRTYLPLCSDPAMKAALAFIRYLNLSPLEYLTQVRIDRAIELLRNTELSVKEVCFACGFQSPQYFSKVFRRQTGRPPKSIAR